MERVFHKHTNSHRIVYSTGYAVAVISLDLACIVIDAGSL